MTLELTAERLRELLHYDPETGVFTRLVRSGPAKVGDAAGTATTSGYIQIRVDGGQYLAHRLAFLCMTGEWPSQFVDHVNGVRDDNRWSNLRPATPSENLQNVRRARADSQTGLLGVSRDRQRFRAQIKVDGQHIYIGTFDTPEQAHAAYLAAKRKLHAGCTI